MEQKNNFPVCLLPGPGRPLFTGAGGSLPPARPAVPRALCPQLRPSPERRAGALPPPCGVCVSTSALAGNRSSSFLSSQGPRPRRGSGCSHLWSRGTPGRPLQV